MTTLSISISVKAFSAAIRFADFIPYLDASSIDFAATSAQPTRSPLDTFLSLLFSCAPRFRVHKISESPLYKYCTIALNGSTAVTLISYSN